MSFRNLRYSMRKLEAISYSTFSFVQLLMSFQFQRREIEMVVRCNSRADFFAFSAFLPALFLRVGYSDREVIVVGSDPLTWHRSYCGSLTFESGRLRKIRTWCWPSARVGPTFEFTRLYASPCSRHPTLDDVYCHALWGPHGERVVGCLPPAEMLLLLLLLANTLSLIDMCSFYIYSAVALRVDVVMQNGPSLCVKYRSEINHAGAGGIWAELVSNRGFEAGGPNTPSNIDPWSIIGSDSLIIVSTDRSSPFSRNKVALRMDVLCDKKGSNICPPGGVGIYNPGYWGMLIFFGCHTSVFIRSVICQNIEQGKKYKGHGFRNELVSMLADLKPQFIRFPGGCFVEGEWLRNAFRWRETIGPWEERPGHFGDVWKYWTDDGLGYFEFLQLAEDLGAWPIWVFNNGTESLFVSVFNMLL
ncbi:aspartate-semialdehyde dehydrogenase-like protein [Asimina triloba]